MIRCYTQFDDRTFWWLVRGPSGVISLSASHDQNDPTRDIHPLAIAYHARSPMYAQLGKEASDCDWNVDGICYGDITYLGATELLTESLQPGKEPALTIWPALIERYHDMENRQNAEPRPG